MHFHKLYIQFVKITLLKQLKEWTYISKVSVLKLGCNYLTLSSNGQLIFREEPNVSLMLHWFRTTPRGSQEIDEQMRLTTVQYSCNVHWSMYRRSVPHQLLHDNYLPKFSQQYTIMRNAFWYDCQIIASRDRIIILYFQFEE